MASIVSSAGSQAIATAAAAASKSLISRRLYRNLLRTAAPFTSPSPDATVLSCLLQRTGIDDHVDDWESYATGKVFDDDGNAVFSSEDQARDLTYSYADRIPALAGGLPRTKNQTTSNASRDYQKLFRRLLREVVTGTNGFAKMAFPSQVDPTRLRKIIQREFRNGDDAVSTIFDDAARRQTALTAIRELNKKLAFHGRLQKMAPVPNPRQAAWNVSPLDVGSPSFKLRPGMFLVSHPFMNDGFFSKSVICILDHTSIHDLPEDENDESYTATTPAGSYQMHCQTYGLIINRVSVRAETGRNRTLKEAFQEHMLPERITETFGNCIVRSGGPVHVSLQMIYSAPPSSSEQGEDVFSTIGGKVIPAVEEKEGDSSALYSDRGTYFQGHIFKAASAIENGTLDRDDVSFFVGASTWSHGQLASEIARGYWIPCRGPPEMALHGICEHEPGSASGKRPLTDLWLSMMSACGEDAAKLAHLFYHEDQWDENGLACDAFDDSFDDILVL
jgi:putative AlgH/UPF0301 family transcriptional regulator